MTECCFDVNLIPTTRYQGSKRRLIPWLHDNFSSLIFDSALDLFGGTSAVSYLLKKMGKKVTYNDILSFNYWIGVALIKNNKVVLDMDDLNNLKKEYNYCDYENFIEKNYKEYYFNDAENIFLDKMICNINHLFEEGNEEDIFKKSIAYYALFQSCLIKRPFNLFHRKNLYLRNNDVNRNFGNKKTWDVPFNKYFDRFVMEANSHIFDNGRDNESKNKNAIDFSVGQDLDYDLVYIDPPYVPIKNPNQVCNYSDSYHFLEGIVNYYSWKDNLCCDKKHKPYLKNNYDWSYECGNIKKFEKIFEIFQDSIYVVSYKEPGLPSIESLVDLILQFKKAEPQIVKIPHTYALNKNNGHYKEVLIISKR